MKILLTGSNGMLGSWIAEHLSASHHETLATGKGSFRLPASLIHENFTYTSLDITDRDAVLKCIKAFAPDTIIHSAAITQVDDCELNKSFCYSVNVDGTKNIIDAAKEVDASICYLSTDFVFSGEAGPYQETDSAVPVNYYGVTKLLAEELVRKSGLHWCTIRTILLYGKADPLKRSNFVYWVKKNLEEGTKIKVVNDQIRTPTYIPDLVNGIFLCLKKEAQGVFHISGADVLTPFEMAIAIANRLKLNKDLLEPVDASSFSQAGRRPLKTGFIIEKAKKELGYSPTDFQTSLKLLF
jgi:dTDP-4-dehydrorhamnose reductase